MLRNAVVLTTCRRDGQMMLWLKSISRCAASCLSLSHYTAHLATADGPRASLPTRKSPMILRHHRLAAGAAVLGRNWPPTKATLPSSLFAARRRRFVSSH